MIDNTKKPQIAEENIKKIQFADHSIFFDKFYEKRDIYVSLWNEAMDNPQENIKEAYKALGYLIQWGNSQLRKVSDYNTILNDYDEITSSINSKNYSEALSEMREVFEIICDGYQKVQFEPSVESTDDDSQFWREEEQGAMRQMKKGFYDIIKFSDE